MQSLASREWSGLKVKSKGVFRSVFLCQQLRRKGYDFVRLAAKNKGALCQQND